jgi:hypothetical protein
MIRITGLYHLQQQTIRYGTGTKKTSSNKEGTVTVLKNLQQQRRYDTGTKNLQQQRRYGTGTKKYPFLTSVVDPYPDWIRIHAGQNRPPK